MTEDVVDHIVKFLEREEDVLPPRVTNGMILIALREVRDDVKKTSEVLKGQRPDGQDGLIHRVEMNEKFRGILLWLFSPIMLAFLGGLGEYIFKEVFH